MPTLTADELELASKARHWAKSGAARIVREGADLTLGDVGAAVGVSTAAVSRWESGSAVPRTRHAVRWAKLMETIASANYHLGGERGLVPEQAIGYLGPHEEAAD